MSFDVRTHYQEPETARRYDAERFSSLSGRVFRLAERRALRRALALLPAGARVLDAPCGTGRLLPLFLDAGLRPIGGDISGEMIAVARQRTSGARPPVRFSRMDFTDLPLADGAVQATFSIRFLPHIPADERLRMLREFRRVSQRWVIISLSISTPWHRLRRRIKAWLGHPKPVRHPVTAGALREELRRVGLREVRRWWTFPILSEQVLVLCERA
jgi:ubiquinone/menaquinone biosynthesis C-methylase UbiE